LLSCVPSWAERVICPRAGEVLTQLCSVVTEALDQERPVPAEMFFVCRILGPEYLWFAADNLVQWLGGRGYLEPTRRHRSCGTRASSGSSRDRRRP
jgi:hypothetical protein